MASDPTFEPSSSQPSPSEPLEADAGGKLSGEAVSRRGAGDLSEQLRASQGRYRDLFLQEQRRARHLSLLNEVQKCALATREVEAFLPQVTRAIGSHFSDCDVTFYLSPGWSASATGASIPDGNENVSPFGAGVFSPVEGEEGPRELVAVAASGRHRLGRTIGASFFPDESWERAWDEGSADGNQDSRDHAASSPTAQHVDSLFHPESRSFLGVPLLVESREFGMIVVQSRESDLLDGRDMAALNTAAAIIASHLHSSRLFRNMSEVNDFNRNLLNSMSHSLLVVDSSGHVRFANDRLLRTFGLAREAVRRQPLEAIFGESPARHHDLRAAIAQVLRSGAPREVPEVHVWTPEGAQIFDVRLFRVFFRGRAEAAMLLINLTQRWRKAYQLQMMNEIGRLFGGSLDIERVLGTVLTCITAGNALGFNRAFVFLFDESQTQLEGRMALGPSTAEEAAYIWNEISQRELTLDELLENGGATEVVTPLQQQTRALSLCPDNPYFPALKGALRDQAARRATRDEFIALSVRPRALEEMEPAQAHAARLEAEHAAQLWHAAEIAIAPLVAKDRLVGVVFADNLYSGAPIETDDVQLLDTLAGQAGLTIDNALTYRALQHAQKELVSAERLVAVGEMSARVSHEIRNPLATIGGFARSVLKKPSDVEGVKRKTSVVVAEVARLEELLTDLLDMARPRPLDLRPHSVNEIVEHALLLAEADLRACNAEVERELKADLPPLEVDRSRLLQALLNTIRNGAQAMPSGGVLRVATRLAPLQEGQTQAQWLEIEVADSGVGISERALKQVFDPFFSTKVSGSGLGLAVTKRIIQDHGGRIDVRSRESQGTCFVFSLPLQRPTKPTLDSTSIAHAP